MTRDDFNRKVEEVRWLWPDDAFRVQTNRDRAGKMVSADYQVYLNERWHTVGTQRNPLGPNVECEWDDAKVSKPETDRLQRLYLQAKTEFERIAHSETIRSDDYEAARDRAKAALKDYQDFTARRSSS